MKAQTLANPTIYIYIYIYILTQTLASPFKNVLYLIYSSVNFDLTQFVIINAGRLSLEYTFSLVYGLKTKTRVCIEGISLTNCYIFRFKQKAILGKKGFDSFLKGLHKEWSHSLWLTACAIMACLSSSPVLNYCYYIITDTKVNPCM